MSDTITLTGIVGTLPRAIKTPDGLFITSFRLASSQRRYDRREGAWVDGDTNWYTITTFRQLAVNVGSSISRSDRVVVTGRLRIREWQSGERTGTTVEIEADAVGHDLAWGTTSFTRVMLSSSTDKDDAAAATPETDDHGWPTVLPGSQTTGSPAGETPAHGDDDEDDGGDAHDGSIDGPLDESRAPAFSEAGQQAPF
jgi:single-strand DNA-binding protein